MDIFLAGCQGFGLALAAGIFAGASGRRGAIGWALLAIAAVGGAILFGLSLETEDHPGWPGWPLGALVASFAFVVTRDIAEGAMQRAEGAGASGLIISVAALVLAGLSLLLPPVALIALAGLVWLAFSRRKRAARKYEGLRTLR